MTNRNPKPSMHPERGDLDKMSQKPLSVRRELEEARQIVDGQSHRGLNRQAFAESLAEEVGRSVADEDFMAASDRILMRLYARGYVVMPLKDDSHE